MIVALVWVLMVIPYDGGGKVDYSPPVQDLASCQRMLKATADTGYSKQCVQINLVLAK